MMTKSDIYEKIKELEDSIPNSIGERHILIPLEMNYWYLLGKLEAYRSMVN